LAAGFLFITPLGDLVRRRSMLLNSLVASIVVTVLVGVSPNIESFLAFLFFLGMTNGANQVLLPVAVSESLSGTFGFCWLRKGMCDPAKKGLALAITLTGCLAGGLFGRVFAGLVAQYLSWRDTYYITVSMLVLASASVYFLLPDTPRQAKGVSYFAAMASLPRLFVTEPALLQSTVCLIFMEASWISYFVNLTFLRELASSSRRISWRRAVDGTYGYSSTIIGLFALVGLLGVITVPLSGRLADGLNAWTVAILGCWVMLLSAVIYATTAGLSPVAVAVVTYTFDAGLYLAEIGLVNRYISIDPTAANRFNVVGLLGVSSSLALLAA
jgi:predicted MFS family arabinose efflux permease